MKKRLISMFAVITMLATLVAVPVSADADVWNGSVATGYASGSGTQADPYIISTGAQLAYLAQSVNSATGASRVQSGLNAVNTYASEGENPTNSYPTYKVYTDTYFKLGNDINLNNVEWTPIGNSVNTFDGKFDGNGKVIKNLKISTMGSSDAHALFGATSTNTSISKLGIDGVNIAFANGNDVTVEGAPQKNRSVGAAGLVGILGGGTYSDCFVRNGSLAFTGAYVQGIGGMFGTMRPVDKNKQFSITNCYVTNMSMSGGGNKGGLFGQTSFMAYSTPVFQAGCSVTNCYTADIDTDGYSLGADCRHGVFLTVKSNLYTTGTKTTSDSRDVLGETMGQTKAQIKASMLGLTDTHFVLDSGSAPVNNGYPVLSWEKTWEDTDINTLGDLEFSSFHEEPMNAIMSNISLPAKFKDVTILWTSSDPSVIKIEGSVAKVIPAFENKDVNLTAMDDETGSVTTFPLTVLGAFDTAIQKGLNGQTMDNITSDITLPTVFTYDGASYPIWWASSDPVAMDDNGKLGTIVENANITLMAYSKYDQKYYEFSVTVRPDGAVTDEDLANHDLEYLKTPMNYLPLRTDKKITLSTSGHKGSSISWTSLTPDVMTVSGNTATPNVISRERVATLRATATKGSAIVTKDFNITVEALKDYAVFQPEITKSGTVSNEIVAGGTVSSAYVTVYKEYTEGDKVIAALYNSKGGLEGVASQPIPSNIAKEVATKITFDSPITLPANITGMELKLFIWNGVDITPLASEYASSELPKTNVWIFGDSTVAYYRTALGDKEEDVYPKQGWGRSVDFFLVDSAYADPSDQDIAVGGYTATHYLNPSEWSRIYVHEKKFKENDYAIICLGTNDQALGATKYRVGLKAMIGILESHGVIPILVSSAGIVEDSGPYANSYETVDKYIRNLAEEMNIPYVDLATAMDDYFRETGYIDGTWDWDGLRGKFYNWKLDQSDWDQTLGTRIDLVSDYIHLNERGSRLAAYLFARELKKTNSGLAKYVLLDETVRAEWDF